VEEAATADLFHHPFHPYTRGLLQSIPRLAASPEGRSRLSEIPGTVPSLTEPFSGCRFADRCPHVFEPCRQQRPDLFPIADGQRARCWLKEFPRRRTPDA